jgi:universal stress protein E
MRSIRHILLAVKDPSTQSPATVDKAIQLSRSLGASLELFHSITTQVYAGLDLEEGRLAELKSLSLVQNRARLDALAKRGREAGVSITTAVEWDYPPHEAVVRRVLKSKADLIIAECHQGRRVAPLLLQVADWELLRYSPVPVLLVRNKRLYVRPTVLAAIDPTHANAKPTRLDDEILAAAGSFESALKGALHVAHCFVPVPTDAKPSELLSEDATEKLEARARAHARTRLDKAVGKMKIGRGRRHLMSAHPVNAIPRLARKIRCDIVVMGAVSRTGLKRLLIGNTAERIIDDLPCDVLVVKPKDFVTRVRREGRGMRVTMPPLLPLAY